MNHEYYDYYSQINTLGIFLILNHMTTFAVSLVDRLTFKRLEIFTKFHKNT